MFDLDELKAIQGFLSRVQLSAKEAEIFTHINTKIRNEIREKLLLLKGTE